MEVQIPKLEAKQMSGLVTPNRITGDMGGLLSDGSDDDAVEGEVWDDEEEDWDEEEEDWY